MLVVIMPADHQRWLADAEPTAKKLLVRDTGTMTITPVSDRVNDIKQDDAGLIAPLFVKRPPKRPDRVYPLAKHQEYACVYDWKDRAR